jgi:alkanesulfonate monooxygenase SsuD/methylene tetrahydromethanopterin reductase-like flavin-dependent oxidoreductase (luciferase family)
MSGVVKDTQTRPAFSPGSIALGLHASSGSGPVILEALREQAIAASQTGFDGVSLSEHHGGFPQYVPTPTLIAGFLLSSMEKGWAGPCPTILPLRDVVPLVEDLAWLASAYPGRVGAGFVSGYQERDFKIYGRSFSARIPEFKSSLRSAANLLRGEVDGELSGDQALQELAESPIPVVCGVGGPKGAAYAAECNVGILLTSLLDSKQARRLADAYRDSGGTNSCVLVRRAWVGTPPSDFADQLARYEAAATDRGGLETGSGDIVVHGEPSEIASRIAEQVQESGADSLNFRVFAEDAAPNDLVRQVALVGTEVLPALRSLLNWNVPHIDTSRD